MVSNKESLFVMAKVDEIIKDLTSLKVWFCFVGLLTILDAVLLFMLG